MVPFMNNKPNISIIIPTKNRQIYALSLIRSILNFKSDLFELIVHDNSNQDSLKYLISEFENDERLRYFYTNDNLGVNQNFTLATKVSQGEYICYLGDDDGVTEEIVTASLWAKKHDYDAVYPSCFVHYLWPDVKRKIYGQTDSGSLLVEKYTGSITHIDTQKEIIRCAKDAGYNLHLLPRAYFGIVKKEIMENILHITGTYFPGPSPDLSSAIAIALLSKNSFAVDYPIFIHGTSSPSGGGMGLNKKHVGDLSHWPHLSKQYIDNWSNIVPKFFSGNTIWAEDVIQSLKAMKRDDLIIHFNIHFIHALCIVFNPQYFKLIINNYVKYFKYKIIKLLFPGVFYFSYYILFISYLRLISLLKRKIFYHLNIRGTVFKNIQDIQEAIVTLEIYLKKHKIKLDEITLSHIQ